MTAGPRPRRRPLRPAPLLVLAGVLASGGSCATDPGPGEAEAIEATSLLGAPLPRPPLPDERRRRLEADLEAARSIYGDPPTSEEGYVWVGRRLGYLGRYREAVEVFSLGIEEYPDSFRLRRHRGHRYLTLRRIREAIADLSEAADLVQDAPDEIEPDGAPNRFGVPRSTTQSNIWYHLGLAHYLSGDWPEAEAAYRAGMAFAVNDDMLVAMSYWHYLALRRLGRDEEAAAVLDPIRGSMEILENDAYHALLLVYRGDRPPEGLFDGLEDEGLDFATVGYGIAEWRRLAGDDPGATELLQRIVAGSLWPAFGHLAAEAELARAAGAT